MLNVPDLMARLAKLRPVFHSEADFQHELAWLIHTLNPTARIRLERPFKDIVKERAKLDLWVEIDGEVDAVELKYQTDTLSVDVKGERFELGHKGADDNLGYDFLSDLARVERLAMSTGCTGHAILLSNEPNWRKSGRVGQFNKDAFRIHDGREVEGILSWRTIDQANERAAALELKGRYTSKWRDYCKLEAPRGRFRYLWLCASGVPQGSELDV